MMTSSFSLVCPRRRYQVLKASGHDIRPYLQTQITQDIQTLTPEHPIYTAVLTPQGKMVADMHIIDMDDELILISSRNDAVRLVERLRQFSLGHNIRLGMVESLSLLSIQSEQDFTLPHNIEPYIQARMPMPEAAVKGLWLVIEEKDMEQVLTCLSSLDAVHICHDSEMDAASIVYGRPCFGRDWDASIHPMNANLLEMKGVSFDKGCYVGQEVTSRMHWRGGVKKKLYHVRIKGDMPSTPIAIQSNVNIGVLNSAAQDDAGQVWGIAHLPIESVRKNSTLSLENGTPIEILEACHA